MALSRNQFAMSDFSREGYTSNEVEGTLPERLCVAYGARNATLSAM